MVEGLPANRSATRLASLSWRRNVGSAFVNASWMSGGGKGLLSGIRNPSGGAYAPLGFDRVGVLPLSARRIVADEVLIELETGPVKRVLHMHLPRPRRKLAVAVDQHEMGSAAVPDDSGAYRKIQVDFVLRHFEGRMATDVLLLQVAGLTQRIPQPRREIAQSRCRGAVHARRDLSLVKQHVRREAPLRPNAARLEK